MRNNIEKGVKTSIYLLFEIAIAFSFYDLSLHSNFVSWGDSRRDGLDMLSVFYLAVPTMAIMSLAKILFWKKYSFNRFSSLLYTGIFFVAFLCYAFTSAQIVLLIAMFIALLIAIINIVEFCAMLRKNYRDQS